MNHTKEPWIIREVDGLFAIAGQDGFALDGKKEDYERVVLAVNACTGIPDEVLAGALHHGVDPLQKRIAELEAEVEKFKESNRYQRGYHDGQQEAARRSQFWKDEHIAGNKRITELEMFVERIRLWAHNNGEPSLDDMCDEMEINK